MILIPLTVGFLLGLYHPANTESCSLVVESCAYCTDDGLDFYIDDELMTLRILCK